MVSIGAIDTSDTSNTSSSSNYSSNINANIGNSNITNSSSDSIDSESSAQQVGLFTNASATTDAAPTSEVPISLGIQVEEVIIVCLIVIFWILAVAAFRRKWDSIRIMQPMEPRYKHIPKNLDSVKVVKRAQDSVIYKSYSRKMSVTMVARENRHLQRTLTMPCMNTLPSFHEAIGSTAEAAGFAGTKPRHKQTLPTIHMEEATTEM